MPIPKIKEHKARLCMALKPVSTRDCGKGLEIMDEPTGALDSRAAGTLLENFRIMNERKQATILMVTHDAYTASHCKRILFIKDGKVFNELVKGTSSRKEFFDDIMKVVSALGGDNAHVI